MVIRNLLDGAGSASWAIASPPEVQGGSLGAAALSSAWCLLDTQSGAGSCLQKLISKSLGGVPVVISSSH